MGRVAAAALDRSLAEYLRLALRLARGRHCLAAAVRGRLRGRTGLFASTLAAVCAT